MRMGSVECSKAALAMLHNDLLRRCPSSNFDSLGTLLKYHVVVSGANQPYASSYRRHAYLYETAVVVMSDGDVGFTPITMEKQHEHPLKLLRLFRLCDLTAIVPSHALGSSVNFIYDLIFKHRDEGCDFTLSFNDILIAVAWTTAIRRLQYRGDVEELDPAETEDIAAFESFAAMMQVFRWQLPISQPLGRVIYHGRVTVRNLEKAIGLCQLVLFDHALVFIQGSPPEARRHLLASRITSVTRTIDNAGSITLTYSTEFEERIRLEEFRFMPAEPETDVNTWLRILHSFAPNASTQHDVYRKLRSLAQTRNQNGSVRQPEKLSTWVAGLAMLHPTPITNELNMSVAVMPNFESEGIATYLLAYILEVAFEKLGAHRVQVRVVHSSTSPSQTARAVRMFIHLGFTHEGIRRRSVLHPTEGLWADVSVLAMLELDWIRRATVTPAKGTLWDEMFARQQREREMLLSMESSPGLQRTRSMETIRDIRSMNDAVPSASMVSPSVGYPTVTSNTTSQSSVLTALSSWVEISDGSGQQIGGVNGPGVVSMSSADDAADEYEDWDLEEDYSDNEDADEDQRMRK